MHLAFSDMSQNTDPAQAGDSKEQPTHPHRSFLHSPRHGWLHEFEKRVMGQSPKGSPLASPRPSNVGQQRPNSVDLDRIISNVQLRTARYGGDDPLSPQDDPYGSQPSSQNSAETTRVPPSPAQPEGPKLEHKQDEHSVRQQQERSVQNDNSSDERHRKSKEHSTPRGNPNQPADPNQVGWDGPDDPENPQNWSQSKKWFITGLVSFLTVNVTFASSAPSSATTFIARDFGIGLVTAELITTLFLAGYCLGPIIWGATSELVGRKVIFSISMLMYTLFILGQALAPNPQTLFITRFLSGVCAAAPLTNAGGVVADLWDPVGRGFAMSLFSSSVFIGPALGPLIGGFVTVSYLGWRWVFWVMMIFAAFCWILTILFLPETFAPVLLVRKAKRFRKRDPENNKNLYAPHEKGDFSIKALMHRTLLRPFQILGQEPILVMITVYISVVYGILYGLFEAVPVVFDTVRGFDESKAGLIFIAVGIGTTIGGIISVLVQLRYKRLTPFWHNVPPPEERLWGSMIAGPVLVLGCFWFGWTGQYAAVPWYVPALALVPIGMSFTLVFISLLSYIVDCYMMYAASALAVNTIFRSAFAAAFPLFVRQMFLGMGIGWAASLLGFVALVLTPFPYIFYIYGAQIRGLSKFAPAMDLKVRKKLEEEGKLPEDSTKSAPIFDRNGNKAAKKEHAAQHDPES